MASVNKWIGIGNLGRDPEARTFPSGDMVCNITIACTDKWKDRESGEMKEHTEWVRIVFNGRLAEIANQYLRKGAQVYIEGSIRTRKYQKDGVDHYATEIRADQMQMLGARQDGGGGRGGDGGGGYDDGGYDQGGRQAGQQQPQRQQGSSNQGGGQQRQAPQGQQRQAPQQNQQRGPQQGQQRQAPQGAQGGGGGGFQSGGSGFDDMDSDIPFVDCSMIHDMESKLDRRIRKSRV